MAYQALYRKWRPLCFDDVIGQQHITQTLKNEIVLSRTSHAYLFTGIRGTGKTSTAKILSRAVNCLQNNDGDPCNLCESCKGILDGSILDVIEIDAASNNGVDNIRAIREEVVYTAASTKYKVYIIDEVHMLSSGAFNALLKTLEEPPAHVIFILATTEVHKIPATILSRCQRFDFRRITADAVAGRLKEIAKADGIEMSEEVPLLIANLAEGSMRDALSILDRCLACGGELTYGKVVDILGIADGELTEGIAQFATGSDAGGAMELIAKAVADGKPVPRIADGLIKIFRDLLICKVTKTPGTMLEYTEDRLLKLRQMSDLFGEGQILNALRILSSMQSEMKYSQNQRIHLEMAVVKLCLPEHAYSQEALMARIEKLEEKLLSADFSPQSQRPLEVVQTKVVEPQKQEAKSLEEAPQKTEQEREEVPHTKPRDTKTALNFAQSDDQETPVGEDLKRKIMMEVRRKKPGLAGMLHLVRFAEKNGFLMFIPMDEEGMGMGKVICSEENKKLIGECAATCGKEFRGILYKEEKSEMHSPMVDDFITIIDE